MSNSRENKTGELSQTHNELERHDAEFLLLSETEKANYYLEEAQKTEDKTTQFRYLRMVPTDFFLEAIFSTPANDPLSSFHFGCGAHHKGLIQHGIANQFDLNAPIYLTSPRFGSFEFNSITPFAITAINHLYSRTESIDCLNMLVEHGANPYCLFTLADGTEHSIFYFTEDNRELALDYIDILIATNNATHNTVYQKIDIYLAVTRKEIKNSTSNYIKNLDKAIVFLFKFFHAVNEYKTLIENNDLDDDKANRITIEIESKIQEVENESHRLQLGDEQDYQIQKDLINDIVKKNKELREHIDFIKNSSCRLTIESLEYRIKKCVDEYSLLVDEAFLHYKVYEKVIKMFQDVTNIRVNILKMLRAKKLDFSEVEKEVEIFENAISGMRKSLHDLRIEKGKVASSRVKPQKLTEKTNNKPKRIKTKVRLPHSDSKPEVANIAKTDENESNSLPATLKLAIENYNADLNIAKASAALNFSEIEMHADDDLKSLYKKLVDLTEIYVKSFEEIEAKKEKLRQAKADFNKAYKLFKNTARSADNIDTPEESSSDNDDTSEKSSSDHNGSKEELETDKDVSEEEFETNKIEIKLPVKQPTKLQFNPEKDRGTAYRKNLDDDNDDDDFVRMNQNAKRKIVKAKPVNAAPKKESLPTHVSDKLQLCEKTLTNLQALQAEYKRYVTKIDNREADDFYSMQLICNMEHELLRLFETLLVLQDNPDAKVFLSDKTARQLRNLSKYGSYIYGFNTDYIIQLAQFAGEKVSPVINARIKQQVVTTVSNVPNNLYRLLANEKVQVDNDLALARYQFLFATLQKQNENQAEVSTSLSRLNSLSMQTGAQLACLLRIGDIFKEMNHAAPMEQYSDDLRKVIKANSAAGSPTLFRQPLTTPLLTYFEVTLKQEQGFALLQRIIQNLSRADMVLLLKELRDLQSHKTEDEWMALTNPQMNELVSFISNRALALHQAVEMNFLNQRPANFSFGQVQTAEKLHQDLDNYFSTSIKSSDYFTDLMLALTDISQNRRAEATIRIQKLTSGFEKFSTSYLYLGAQKDEVKRALDLLGECLERPRNNFLPA